MLLELSKSKLRRKHTAEVASLLLQSASWRATLESDEVLQNQIRQLPEEFRGFLGSKIYVEEPTSPKTRQKNKKVKSPPPSNLKNIQSTPPQPTAALLEPIAPPRPLTQPLPQPVAAVEEVNTNNPFTKGSNLRLNISDPSNIRWWETSNSNSAAAGPDYQRIFLLHKTAQLEKTQERILSQQREILQKHSFNE